MLPLGEGGSAGLASARHSVTKWDFAEGRLFIHFLISREIMVDDGGIYFSIICICIGRTLRIFDKS